MIDKKLYNEKVDKEKKDLLDKNINLENFVESGEPCHDSNHIDNNSRLVTEENNFELLPDENLDEKEAKINKSLSWSTFPLAKRLIGWELLNIFAVYYLEYLCFTSFADRANPSPKSSTASWAETNGYKIAAMGYQIGVLTSQLAFRFFKCHRVGMVTILQFINTCVYAWIAKYKNVSVYAQFGFMVYIGVLGGTSFVNCMFLILTKKELEKGFKEVMLNLTTFALDLGQLLASFSAMVIANLLLKD